MNAEGYEWHRLHIEGDNARNGDVKLEVHPDMARRMRRDGKLQPELTLTSLFGFLTGATTAGAGMYYYVIDEYRVSNQLLTEDIYVRAPLTPNPEHTLSSA